MTFETRPYVDLHAWRADMEQLVLIQIERAIRLDRAGRRVANLPELARHLSGEGDAEATLASFRAAPGFDPAGSELAAFRTLLSHRRQASEDLVLPLDTLAERLALSEVEVDLVRLLWIAQTSPELHRLLRAFWSDQDGGPIRAEVALALLTQGAFDRSRLVQALAPTSALRRWRVVLSSFEGAFGPWIPLELPDAVVRLLEGHPTLHRLGIVLGLNGAAPDAPAHKLTLPEQWATLAGLVAEPRPRVVLVAPEGAAVRSLIQAAAFENRRPLVVLDAHALQKGLGRGSALVDELLRDALLLDAWILVELPQSIPDDRDPLFDNLARDLAELPLPVFVVVERRSRLERRLTRGFTPLELAPLGAGELAALWTAAAPTTPRPPPAAALRSLLDDHRLSAEATIGASREAAARAVGSGEAKVELEVATLACQAQIDAAFEGRAVRVEARFRFEDLVLPADTQTELTEVLAFANHKAQVFDSWGFGAKYPYGSGLSALFSGPSGTGKTMAACVLAASLDRPLYRVDLSQIFDRYVGETEKNLARIFDAAEAGRVILLFDEADALFAQRSEVKSSNDRYANLEVNYLLQKMEEHRGIALLTTNLDASIDVAFRRRIRFTVHFPFPDEQTRALLWSSMMPAKSQLEVGIDWSRLARSYELAGGGIKNAVLRAAFLAAHEGSSIGIRHLMRAAQLECAAMGKLVRAGD